jgi:hypothetical protein
MNKHAPSISKYAPLKSHLERVHRDHLPIRFAEIEAILGFRLPPSSRKHRAWWSNNPSNSVITHSWLDAGFRTEAVDLEEGRLVFRRTRAPEQARAPSGRHPILGCMKGSVTFAPDYDPGEPADPEWGESAYGETP